MPESPEALDPEEGAAVVISAQQLRKNGMLKVAATFHAPAEIKNVPLTVRCACVCVCARACV